MFKLYGVEKIEEIGDTTQMKKKLNARLKKCA